MGIFPECFVCTDSDCLSLSATANQSSNSTQIEELCRRFPLSQLRKLTGNFDKRRITVIGPRYDIYKACIDIEGAFHEIAIKKMRSNSARRLAEFNNEIQILCQLRHPNLITLIGFYKDKRRKILVLEYMSNGSLCDQLYSKKKELLSWKIRLQICIGAARGLHYVHAGVKRTIFHRDVQPINILLDENFVPKLANFAFSLKGPHFMSKPTPKNLDNVVGTIGFIAPEYYRDFMFTDKCDVYSFGMVLLVVACALEPEAIIEKMGELLEDQDDDDGETEIELFDFFKKNAKQICKFLQEGKAHMIVDPFLRGKIAPQCWKMFLGIAERCLLEDPTERPTMGEVEVELEDALALQEEADAINPLDLTERPTMGEVEVELEDALALQEEADAINPLGDYSLLSI